MNKIQMTRANRFKEIVCVLFGHDWNGYGSKTTETGRILEEYSTCGCCGLENHDRSGYLAEKYYDTGALKTPEENK